MMTATLRMIEKELVECQSELCYLIGNRTGLAGNNWLGVEFEDILTKNLTWDEFIRFLRCKDTLVDQIVEFKAEDLLKIRTEVASLVFDSQNMTLTQETSNGKLIWTLKNEEPQIFVDSTVFSIKFSTMNGLYQSLSRMFSTIPLKNEWNKSYFLHPKALVRLILLAYEK